MMASSEPRRRSALQFALDVTGGREVVYRVAVYLQDLRQKLATAPGLLERARLDLILFDELMALAVAPDRLLDAATRAATGHAPFGVRLGPLIDQIKALPFEGGGFHTFILLTRPPAPEWQDDLPALHQLVGSVTGLCCGPECSPEAARLLSKEPGGTRIVDPLDTIKVQFDAIAAWLIANFADKPDPFARHDAHAPPDPRPAPDPASDIARLPTKPVFAAKWRVQEPSDPTDATEHTVAQALAGAAEWRMLGASRRGKMHAHEGTYRDDAFALGTRQGWNLVAVADGAGSCRLSRVGAHVATEAAIAGMQRGVDQHRPTADTADPTADVRAIIIAGFEAAQAAVYTEAARREIAVRDLSATLLLLAHHPDSGYLAAGQIGDGLIMAVQRDQTLHMLGEADKGLYSGETVFLPGVAAHSWASHAWVTQFAEAPEMALVMTDGIADDLIPYQKQAPTLINGIRGVLGEAQPAQALLELIGYEKRDSADDRTLVVLHHDKKQA